MLIDVTSYPSLKFKKTKPIIKMNLLDISITVILTHSVCCMLKKIDTIII